MFFHSLLQAPKHFFTANTQNKVTKKAIAQTQQIIHCFVLVKQRKTYSGSPQTQET